MSTSKHVDYYAILQVTQTANRKEIETAIREQRRRWAKRAAQADPRRRAEAEERMRHLDQAERVLHDPEMRRKYDRYLETYQPPAPVGAEASGSRNWLELAQQYLYSGNPFSANYAAREAINIQGSSHEAWYIRAHSSFVLGKANDAEYEFNEAIRLKPDNPDYHFDLAEAYADLGKMNDALKEYSAALTLRPSNPVYKTAIANVYLVKEDPARALELMEDVTASHPEEQVFQFYLAWAMHDYCLTLWAKLKGSGKYMIISPAQIEVTEQLMTRASRLQFNDSILRASIEENLALAAEAKATTWVHSQNWTWYAGAAFVCALAIPANGLGLLPLALVIYVYWARHNKPQWKHQYEASRGRLSSEGLQGTAIPRNVLGMTGASNYVDDLESDADYAA